MCVCAIRAKAIDSDSRRSSHDDCIASRPYKPSHVYRYQSIIVTIPSYHAVTVHSLDLSILQTKAFLYHNTCSVFRLVGKILLITIEMSRLILPHSHCHTMSRLILPHSHCHTMSRVMDQNFPIATVDPPRLADQFNASNKEKQCS